MTTPTPSQVIERTRLWVRETFLYMRPDWPLGDTDPLLAGVIDSVGVIELVEFLQETFGIAVAESDITAGNLGSLSAIAAFVVRRSGGDDKEGIRAGARQVA